MKNKQDIDLFSSELMVIEKARNAIEKASVSGGPSTEEFRELLEKYTRLFRQSRRLIGFSDRMQGRLAELNQRLRRSEAKYKTIFKNAAEGIFRSDPDGKLMEINPAMARILRCLSRKDSIRVKMAKQVLEAQKGYMDLVEDIGKTGEERQCQTELVLDNGDSLWVELRARPFFDGSGKMP